MINNEVPFNHPRHANQLLSWKNNKQTNANSFCAPKCGDDKNIHIKAIIKQFLIS